MSCISRRAHADRNSFKLFKEENGSIKERNYVWTEYKCPNEVLKGSTFCSQCSHKVTGHKYQSAAKFNHGIIGGPYTKDSKLYGSEYYLGLIKQGWKIREEDERRAKEAQQKANMPPRKPKVDETGSGPALTIKTVIPTDTLVSPSTLSPSLSNPSPKKPRKIKVSKPVVTPLPVTGPAEFLESVEAPIQVSEVIVVKVKKIRCQGSDYYYDSKSGKLYAVSAKGVGPYKGRYNPTDETIHTEYPDSDDE